MSRYYNNLRQEEYSYTESSYKEEDTEEEPVDHFHDEHSRRKKKKKKKKSTHGGSAESSLATGTSSSSNILEAYRKLSQQNANSNSNSLRESQSNFGSASTQQTPATSTSTQMSTDENSDQYLQDSPVSPPPLKSMNTNQPNHSTTTRTTRRSTKKTVPRELVPEYESPEFPRPPKPPKRNSNHNQSKGSSTGTAISKLSRHTEKNLIETVPENDAFSQPSPSQSQSQSQSFSESKGEEEDSEQPSSSRSRNKSIKSNHKSKTKRKSKANPKVPVQQVYAKSYSTESLGTESSLPNNNSPLPYADNVVARNTVLRKSNNNNNNTTSDQYNRNFVTAPPPPHMTRAATQPTMVYHQSNPPPPPFPNMQRATSASSATAYPSYNRTAVDSMDRSNYTAMDQSSNYNNYNLRESLANGRNLHQARDMSRRMNLVKDNLRKNISVPDSIREVPPPPPQLQQTKSGRIKHAHKKKTKKHKKNTKDISSKDVFHDDDDSSGSSSSSSSGGGGIMGFLSGFGGHPKPQMTEEERRIAHNPFLNRPTAVQKFNTVGHYGDKKKHKDDGASSSYTGSKRHELDDDDSSYTSTESDTKEGFPLPGPVRMLQQFCGKIVTNTSFQIFMVVLIMLNALILGVATYDFPDHPAVPDFLEVADRVLLVIFTIELALQFGYCGINLFLDGWLVFDCLTVMSSWWLEGVQVFRSFRIFRSFRLIVRLPLLKNLVLTVFHVMPRIYSILCLLLLVLYVFGVLCTILFGYQKWGLETWKEPVPEEDKVDYFGHLGLSILTLFQMVCLEGWGEIVRSVAAEHAWYATVILCAFVILTGFIMYNLIVAVMCDSMLVIEAQGREELREQQKEKQLLDEIAKQEEEKRMHDVMVAQRRAEGRGRNRLKGIIADDPTVREDPDLSHSSELSHSEGSFANLSEEEEEEDIQYRDVICPNCEHCQQIPKYSKAFRSRKEKREATMAENQERVRLLKGKMEQLAETQTRVTNVLQTLMFEIETSRMANLGSDGDTLSHSLEDFSLEDYKNR